MPRLILAANLLMVITLFSGCSLPPQYSQISYLENEIIHFKNDADCSLLGKLVYNSGAYFLMIQYDYSDRDTRKRKTSLQDIRLVTLNGKKLVTYENHDNLVPDSSFGGGLIIKLNREQMELAMKGDFNLRTIIWSGPKVNVEVPKDYARRFMAKIHKIYPFTQEDYYVAKLDNNKETNP